MRSALPIVIILSAGCGGDAYPDRYANELCASMYACVDSEIAYLWTGWENSAECRSDTAREVLAAPAYAGWEAGACDYSQREADDCLDDIRRVRSLSVCDGDMELYEFWREALSESCRQVYSCT